MITHTKGSDTFYKEFKTSKEVANYKKAEQNGVGVKVIKTQTTGMKNSVEMEKGITLDKIKNTLS